MKLFGIIFLVAVAALIASIVYEIKHSPDDF